jgi:hypothetical protein
MLYVASETNLRWEDMTGNTSWLWEKAGAEDDIVPQDTWQLLWWRHHPPRVISSVQSEVF